MNICSLLQERAIQHPDRIAIVHDGCSISYGELLAAVENATSELRENGLVPGDRVLLFVPMSVQLYVQLLGVMAIGAVVAFIDPWMKWGSVLAACRTLRPQGFIGIPKAHGLRLLSRELRSVKFSKCIWSNKWRGASPASFAYSIHEVPEDHPALITFTTGSTGIPKAGVRSHGFLVKQHDVLRRYIATKEAEADLTVLPVFVLHNLALGATSVIPGNVSTLDRLRPDVLHALLQTHHIRTSTGSPAFFKRLAQVSPVTLSTIHVGGAPCFPEDVTELLRSFPNTDIKIVYGSTEAEPICEIGAAEMLRLDDGESLVAGTPVPELELRIVRISDQPIRVSDMTSITLPAQEIGEICVAGGHVMTTYLDSPEAFARNKIQTPDAIWHRTGDAGFLDGEGNLHLLGRVEQRIVRDGEMLFPFPLQRQLRSIPGVLEGTVMQFENQCVAVFTATHQISIEVVQRKLPYIQRIVQVEQLPYDPRHHAKLDYTRLKTLIQRR